MLTIQDCKAHTARENVERALQKAKEYEDYHVFLSLQEDEALARADAVDRGEVTGRLAGVPFVAKDNFLTLVGVTTAASKILENFHAPVRATAIEKLEQAGAICIGKANLDAFAHGGSTENSAFGPTKNAVDQTKVAGGSSGGSAVATALDIVPFALGTDTGGSIRQPASFNGVIGMKPTYGMVSRYGVVAMASSTDVVGCFAQTATDVELVLSIIAGRDNRDMTTLPDYFIPQTAALTPRKIGIIKEFMPDDLNSDVRQQTELYIERLKEAGHTVEEVNLPLAPYSLAMYYIVVPAEVASNLARYDGVRYGRRADGVTSLEELYGKSRDEGFVPENKRRIMIGNYVLSSGFFDAYYQKAQRARTLLIHQFNDLFTKYDLLIAPTAPSPAFALGEKTSDPIEMYLSDSMTVGASLAGLPAISVPAGLSNDGLPIGVQLIAQRQHDAQLLQFVRSMEEKNG